MSLTLSTAVAQVGEIAYGEFDIVQHADAIGAALVGVTSPLRRET
ncbi:MAG: hypothetical protein AAB363_02285 [Planctomycetota bacterium]